MAELAVISNNVRTVLDSQFVKKLTSMMLTHSTWPAISAVSREMLIELLSVAIFGLGMSINGLTVDAHRMTLQSHTSCDLFRGPSGSKTAPHCSHNIGVSGQLAMHRAALFISILGDHSMIAV